MPKISIIVPVYNVEMYLERCVDSILWQTFKDFELILINDGSKDNSFQVMKKYEYDKRVRLFNQNNMGPAKTRNKGIEKAVGKYIMFIDSDDYIDNDYVEKYYNASKKGDYDLVIGGYQKITGEKIEFKRQLKNEEFSKYIVTGPVSKLYKKSFLVKNKIEFLDTTASEDVYFNLLAYSKNPTIKIIDDIGYYYVYNPNSLSNTLHKGFKENVDILGLMSEINYQGIKNVELNQYYIIRYLIWYLLYSGQTATSKEFMKEYFKLFNWLNTNIPNYKKNIYIKHCPKGEERKIHLLIYIFIFLHKTKLILLFSKVYCSGGKRI